MPSRQKLCRDALQTRLLLYFPAIVDLPGPMYMPKPCVTDRRIWFALVGSGRVGMTQGRP